MNTGKALVLRYKERLAQNKKSPKIAFFVKDMDYLAQVKSEIFDKNPGDLFFNYLGKKLVMIAQADSSKPLGGAQQAPVPTNGLCSQYTCRSMWGLFTDSRFWSFKNADDTPPQPYRFNGEPEQMAAPVACQQSYMTVRYLARSPCV